MLLLILHSYYGLEAGGSGSVVFVFSIFIFVCPVCFYCGGGVWHNVRVEEGGIKLDRIVL